MSQANGPMRTVSLVARREFSTRVRTKAFLISNAVTLVVILGGLLAFSLFGGGDEEPVSVALVGEAQVLAEAIDRTAAATGTEVVTEEVGDVAAARGRVGSGDLDAAVVRTADGGYTAVVESALPNRLESLLDAAVQQQATAAALEEQGVDPAELAAAAATAVVTVDALDPPDPDSGQRSALAFVTVVLLFFQILLFGLYVAMGVVEEKSSRVVELLLATIRPLHLLTGKVIGIGAVGLVQLAAFGVVGVGTGVATGLLTVTGTAVAVLISSLGWFVLGYTLFAVLYAAAGSLVSRQEDVNSAATPITLLFGAVYVVAQFALSDPDSEVVRVMAWIPPFSAMLMPVRVAAGVAGPGQVIGSIVAMLAVTVVLAVLAARIYQRSVLHSGARLSWRDALRR